MVDSSDHSRVDESLDALVGVLEDPRMQDLPLLILLNKQDLLTAFVEDEVRPAPPTPRTPSPPPPIGPHSHLPQFREFLAPMAEFINKSTSRWDIILTSAATGDGLDAASKWLCTAVCPPPAESAPLSHHTRSRGGEASAREERKGGE